MFEVHMLTLAPVDAILLHQAIDFTQQVQLTKEGRNARYPGVP